MNKDLKNIRSSYKEYKKESQHPVDINTFLDITSRFNKFLISKVLEGKQIVLPARLGLLRIKGKKQKVRFEDSKVVGLAPDWVGTKKLWEEDPEAKKRKQRLYLTNEHTDGVRYKFFWSKKNVHIKYKTLYSLKFTRFNKRSVNKMILEGKRYYT